MCINISILGLTRDQSVQSIRLQQEQLQKLALQAKQRGTLLFREFSLDNLIIYRRYRRCEKISYRIERA